MSTSDHTMSQPEATGPFAPPPSNAPAFPGQAFPGQAAPVQVAPVEIVPRGILFSLAAIPLGMAVTVVIWKLGFVASISSFLIAAAGTFLYAKGAGSAPRRGLVQLVAVILVGVAASFLAIVAADLVEFYNTPKGQSLGYPSVVSFVSGNLFTGDLLSSYGSDLVMFVAFAALGVFGTVRRLLGARRP